MKAFKQCALALAMVTTLAACGGSNSGANNSAATTGNLSLSLTDAPVDNLQAVVITVTGVSVKPQSGDAQTITFDTPLTINMLDLQNGAVQSLLDNYKLDAGTYDWVRLELSTAAGDLYVEDSLGGMVGLTIPSGFQTGLKLNSSFVIPQGGDANFTIDFDLRKSMTKPNGQDNFFLKPSLRLIDNTTVGTLNGEVASSLIQTACANSGTFSGLVYVFSGSDVTPDDYDGIAPDALTSAPVKLNSDTGNYDYNIPFLASGDYTVTYTCDLDDTSVDETLNFQPAQNVTISTGGDSTVNFQ